MGGAPYIRLKQGGGPTFEVVILCITKRSKQCIYCVTSLAKYLVLVQTTVQLCNLHLVV